MEIYYGRIGARVLIQVQEEEKGGGEEEKDVSTDEVGYFAKYLS
jgi:hypothetical protein